METTLRAIKTILVGVCAMVEVFVMLQIFVSGIAMILS